MQVVKYLIQRGVTISPRSQYGQTPADLTSHPEILSLLGSSSSTANASPLSKLSGIQPVFYPDSKPTPKTTPPVPIPSTHPSLSPSPSSSSFVGNHPSPGSEVVGALSSSASLLDCLRVSRSDLGDLWLEYPMPDPSKLSPLTEMLLADLPSELMIFRIIRLPNTIIRNDWDVSRLKPGSELRVETIQRDS